MTLKEKKKEREIEREYGIIDFMKKKDDDKKISADKEDDSSADFTEYYDYDQYMEYCDDDRYDDL